MSKFFNSNYGKILSESNQIFLDELHSDQIPSEIQNSIKNKHLYYYDISYKSGCISRSLDLLDMELSHSLRSGSLSDNQMY